MLISFAIQHAKPFYSRQTGPMRHHGMFTPFVVFMTTLVMYPGHGERAKRRRSRTSLAFVEAEVVTS